MAIDLAKIQARIEKGFKDGEDDDVIAKDLNLTTMQVTNFRVLLGLRYTQSVNVFEASRAVIWDDTQERFKVPAFTIPPEVATKLGLKDGYFYSFFAHVTTKKTIEITIMDKE